MQASQINEDVLRLILPHLDEVDRLSLAYVRSIHLFLHDHKLIICYLLYSNCLYISRHLAQRFASHGLNPTGFLPFHRHDLSALHTGTTTQEPNTGYLSFKLFVFGMNWRLHPQSRRLMSFAQSDMKGLEFQTSISICNT